MSTAPTTILIIIGWLFQISAVASGSVAAEGSQQQQHQQISIRMPDIRPDHAEQYLCIAHRLPLDRDGQFIVEFDPQGDTSRVHHMLMYGCDQPGLFQRDSPNLVWDCGAMHSSADEGHVKSYYEGPVCRGGGDQQILYGWALDAPALKLPKKVGFKVGGLDTNIQFLVLQVHYGHYHHFQKHPDLTDNSGLILGMKPNHRSSGITRQAGVLLLISLGQVATGKSRHEIFCDIDEDVEIHPFRYRVHTHKLGTRVLGAKLGQSGRQSMKYGAEDDVIIGVGDPQQPQMFYPVKEQDLTMKKGDTVYASCEYNNNRTHVVDIGQTGKDEMCNFYLMYWTQGPKTLSKRTCFGHNPKSLFSFQGLWRDD